MPVVGKAVICFIFYNFFDLCFADSTPHVHKHALVTHTENIVSWFSSPLLSLSFFSFLFFNLCFEAVGMSLPASAVNSKRGRTGKRARIPKLLY